MVPSDEPDTVDEPAPRWPADVLLPPATSSGVQLEVAALSHQGHVRTNNEDQYDVVRAERVEQTLLSSVPGGLTSDRFSEVAYGLLVADGIGGGPAGETASSLAVVTLRNLVRHTPDWIMRLDTEEVVAAVMDRMARRYRRIDAYLREQGEANPSLRGMGTTMTLAVINGLDLIVVHVGDSRAYLLRGGQLRQLTRDFTLAQSMVDVGALSPEEAAIHRSRHVLTGALGAGEDRSEPQVSHVPLADGDQILLCTDGLTDLVEDATIRAILCGSASANESCQKLVERALQNGGKDNVTVVLGRYRFPQPP
jgi:protein phosphatase